MNSYARVFSTAALAVLGALMSAPATSAIITYTSRAAFEADTGASSATGPLPQQGPGTPDPATVGSITFDGIAPSSIQLGTFAFPGGWSSKIAGNDLAVNARENFDIVSIGAVYAMGFDAHEPSIAGFGTDTCNVPAGCTDSTFTMTIRNGALVLAVVPVNFPDDVAAFFGVWSDQPFDRIEVRETTGDIDDEFFGEVLTSQRQLARIPEPSTLALLALGIAGLWRRSLRRPGHGTAR